MGETAPSDAEGVGLIPGPGTKISDAKTQDGSNIATNSIKTLKMVHIKDSKGMKKE